MSYSSQLWDIKNNPPTNGVHEDLHAPMMPRHKCGCTWMHERCETGKQLAAQCHELYMKKQRIETEENIQAWRKACAQLHAHIADATSE